MFMKSDDVVTNLSIGELSQATGVEIETIRYYEKSGLLSKPQRSSNGYRVFGQRQLEQLSFIRHCRALDLPLAQVRRLLTSVEKPQNIHDEVDGLIEAQLMRVRARLESMRALEKQLTRLRARCRSKHSTGPCAILGELIAAARGEACACHQE
jgi:DNA-binding transcriptional MerR regulator